MKVIFFTFLILCHQVVLPSALWNNLDFHLECLMPGQFSCMVLMLQNKTEYRAFGFKKLNGPQRAGKSKARGVILEG